MIALITGITGQDGSYLAEFLLGKGYEVHGIVRRSSLINTHRTDHIYDKIHLHYGDMTDATSLLNLVQKIQPVEVYNLAAMSHVKVSFELPEYTTDVVALGTLRILEAIRFLKRPCKFYQASSSELYGLVQEVPQKETTPFHPRSPYAVAKLHAYWLVRNYREAYHLHASNGILFNHESPRRGETFVTRKVAKGISRIYSGKQDILELGNLNAQRDWGHAKDYVRGMWMITQYEKPDDFVLSTGEMHSVREFVEEVAQYFGMTVEWRGTGTNEVGYCPAMDRDIIRINPQYYRPIEVDQLMGDASKADKLLGWRPEISFQQLVKEMCEYEKEDAEYEKN